MNFTVNVFDRQVLPQEQRRAEQSAYRADIDGLRAIAVLSVVGFHAFPGIVHGGLTGVDVFFVISGFLISGILFQNLESGTFSIVDFYGRRIRRIFPALLAVLVACFAIGWLELLPGEFRQLGKHIAGGSGFVANFILWGESGYFDNAADVKPLLHLWSLGVEEQFYITWPVLLWAAWRKRTSIPAVLGLLLGASLLFNAIEIHRDAVATFYSPLTRFWEILTGAGLAWATRRGRIAPAAAQADALSVAGLVAILCGLVLISKARHFPGLWAVLPTMGAALVIAAGPQAWLNRKALSHPVMVWVGLISYPLYLWHWPLLAFARVIGDGPPPAWLRAAIVALSVALAWLTYHLIERPIRFGDCRRGMKAGVLVGLMAVMGITGLDCYARDGFPFRFPKIVRDLTRYEYPLKYIYMPGFCFLGIDDPASSFGKCVTPSDQPKTMMVWGDSHANHLYPGLVKTFGQTFNVVLRSASGCPPILGYRVDNRPFCTQINDYVFDEIRRTKPDRLVLAGLWFNYEWRQIEPTIAKLREMGIANIDLIGPVPRWNDALPKLLYRYFETYRSVPTRMTFGLDPAYAGLDAAMVDFAAKAGVRYVSARSLMCDQNGCITRFGDTGDTLSAWDSGHLTVAGSEYLVGHFPQD